MALRPRCGKWSWRFSYAGREYSGSTGLPATKKNRAAALLQEAESRRLIEQGRELERKLEPQPFHKAVEQFSAWLQGEHREHPATAVRILASLRPAVGLFGSLPIHTITAGRLEDLKAARRAAGISNGTLAADLSALSRLFRYGAKQRWCFQNPVPEVDRPGPAAPIWHVITAAEERAYFDACLRLGYHDLHDVARLMLAQGLRPAEVLALESRDVDLVRGSLAVRTGKTAAARRTLKLAQVSLAIFQNRVSVVSEKPSWRSWQPAGSIFEALEDVQAPPDPSGSFLGPVGAFDAPLFSIKPDALRNCHTAVVRKLGFRFRLYDFRHTFATRAGEAGLALPTLAAILGHSGLKTLPKYIHVRQAAMDEAMQRLSPPPVAAQEISPHARVQ